MNKRIRVSNEFDEVLTDFRNTLESNLGIPISIPRASQIMAQQIKKKRIKIIFSNNDDGDIKLF